MSSPAAGTLPLPNVLVVRGAAAPSWLDRLDGLQTTVLSEDEVRSPGSEDALRRAVEGAGCALVDCQLAVAPVVRRLHEIAPGVQATVIVRPDDRAALQRALLFAPGLGELWLVSPEEVDHALVARAADLTARRERFARTRERLTAGHAAAPERHAERAVVSEAFLVGLLRLLPDPVFAVDEKGRVLSANDAGERLFDVVAPGRRSGSLWSLLRPSDADADPLRATTDGETSFETEIEHRDGTRSRWGVRAIPIRAGTTRAWAVVARDLTQLYDVQRQLEEQAAELEAQTVEMEMQQEDLRDRTDAAERAHAAAEQARIEADTANAAKSQFLATMSHELRTPLNAIVGYAELLDLELSGPLTEGQRGYLTRLQTSGTHLLGLISDILDLAKIDAGGMDVRAERSSAIAAVQSALELAAPQAAQRGVTLASSSGAESVSYAGDADRVRQIVVNLLSNAVKFTERGGHVSVACGTDDSARPDARLTGDGPWSWISVTDTGIGIAPDLQATVFEPFVQVEGGRTREAGGTGLGLAISRRLARLMGGDLTLESALGRGSSFVLWLPGLPAGTSGGETPPERAARARRGSSQHQALGLRDLGMVLRDQLEEILESFVARIRADEAFVDLRRLPQTELEDHGLAFLADLAQSLVVAEENADLAHAQHEDSEAISRVIAERHGQQRRRLGLTEAQIVREYALLMDELTVRLQRHEAGAPDDVRLGIGVLRRLVTHARMVSVIAFRASAESVPAGGR